MAADEPRLYIALYTDEDIDGRLAQQLRERGYDALAAFEVGNLGLTDPAQLDFAIQQKRTLLTYNSQDFEPLFDKLWDEGRTHYGLVISEQLQIGELVRRCIRLFESVTADEMVNMFRNLGGFK